MSSLPLNQHKARAFHFFHATATVCPSIMPTHSIPSLHVPPCRRLPAPSVWSRRWPARWQSSCRAARSPPRAPPWTSARRAGSQGSRSCGRGRGAGRPGSKRSCAVSLSLIQLLLLHPEAGTWRELEAQSRLSSARQPHPAFYSFPIRPAPPRPTPPAARAACARLPAHDLLAQRVGRAGRDAGNDVRAVDQGGDVGGAGAGQLAGHAGGAGQRQAGGARKRPAALAQHHGQQRRGAAPQAVPHDAQRVACGARSGPGGAASAWEHSGCGGGPAA